MDKNAGKINLLIVDDEAQFLESMGKRLVARGFNVMTAGRGEEALEIVRRQPVDIVLLDLKMPGMSGEETLESIKRERARLEIVILTGHGSVDSAAECARLGAYTYLQKPCDLDEILQALADAFKKRILNRMKIGSERLEELLGMSENRSPLAILRRMKELEMGRE